MTLSESIAALVNYGMETGLTLPVKKSTQPTFFWTFFMKMIMKNHHRFHPFLWKRF